MHLWGIVRIKSFRSMSLDYGITRNTRVLSLSLSSLYPAPLKRTPASPLNNAARASRKLLLFVASSPKVLCFSDSPLVVPVFLAAFFARSYKEIERARERERETDRQCTWQERASRILGATVCERIRHDVH